MSRRILAYIALPVAMSVCGLAASAQAWYPDACVSIQSCAPVQSIVWVATAKDQAAQLQVASTHGTTVVPKNFPVQQSQDERIHVCLRYDPFGSLEVACLLMPARIF